MIIFTNKMSSWDKSAFYSRSHAGRSIMLGKWALIKLEFLSPWRCGRQLCPDQTVLWSWVSREKLNTLMQCIYLHLCFKCQDGILWKVEKRQWKWGERKVNYQKMNRIYIRHCKSIRTRWSDFRRIAEILEKMNQINIHCYKYIRNF